MYDSVISPHVTTGMTSTGKVCVWPQGRYSLFETEMRRMWEWI